MRKSPAPPLNDRKWHRSAKEARIRASPGGRVAKSTLERRRASLEMRQIESLKLVSITLTTGVTSPGSALAQFSWLIVEKLARHAQSHFGKQDDETQGERRNREKRRICGQLLAVSSSLRVSPLIDFRLCLLLRTVLGGLPSSSSPLPVPFLSFLSFSRSLVRSFFLPSFSIYSQHLVNRVALAGCLPISYCHRATIRYRTNDSPSAREREREREWGGEGPQGPFPVPESKLMI